ncbi:MAG: sigma-70 family RNA polymerase sigma factor [Phycisphaera sp.]|nr:sigma-70 family RNA polymerase sigma factor [Phycisphaera sp.]
MPEQEDTKQFVADLIAVQQRVHALLLSLLANHDAADEVLQETNTVIWAKREDFTPGTNFGAWACKIAYYQVLAWRKRRKLDRHRFNDALLADLAAVTAEQSDEVERRRKALRSCLDELPEHNRKLIERRYGEDDTVANLAESIGRPATSLYTTLHRLRLSLMDCVQNRMGAEPS